MTSSDPTDPAASFLVRHAAFERRAAGLHATNKAALFAALAAAGVTLVTVAFDGYGDSGQIESIDARAGEAKTTLPAGPVEILSTDVFDDKVERRTQPVSEAIETLAYGFLAETHGGWENNEGAYGEVVFDVSRDAITLQYNERFETSEYHEHEY